jgi:hypothetical protein
MSSRGRQVEAAFHFAIALLTFALFIFNDTRSIRDGVFLVDFVSALPFFLLTPTLIGLSIYVGRRSIAICWVNLLLAAIFLIMPVTREYVADLMRVMPALWGGQFD